MKKILHTVNVPFVIPYILGEQIRHFQKLDYVVYVACSPSDKLIEYKNRWGFELLELNINRKMSLIDDIKDIINLAIFLKKNRIDIIVGHTPKGALISMFAGYFSNVKKRVYFRHGLMFETSLGFKKKLLIQIEKITAYFSTNVICVSDSVLNLSIKYNLGDKKKTVLLGKGSCNGVDTLNYFNKSILNFEKQDKIKLQLNLNPNDFVVGFIGRLAKDKGIYELISAWKILKLKNKNIKLILCGPIDSRDSIDANLLENINNDQTIIYIGETNQTNYFYSIFSIFILPSFREGLPTVVLEASSMELPIITSKSTGCIDSIIENVTGIFSEINPISIANKIQYYIDNKDLVALHGLNGRKFIKTNYEQTTFWKYLEEFYKYE